TELAAAEQIVAAADAEAAQVHRRRGILAGIREQSWRDVDRVGAAELVETLERQLAELEAADGDLQQAIGAEREAKAAKDAAEAALVAQLYNGYRKIQRSIRRENLAEVGQQVNQALQEEKDRAQAEASRAGQSVHRLAAEFKAAWPSVSSQLTAEVEDRRAYL